MRFRPGPAGNLPGLAERNALDRLNRADRLGETPVELLAPGDVGTDARDEAEDADLELAPKRLVLLPQSVDLFDHRLRGARIQAADRGLVDALEVPGTEVVALGRQYGGDLDHVAVHLDPDRREKSLRDRSRGHAGGGLPRAGALQHVSHVRESEFLQACQVGVARPREVGLLDLRVHRPESREA